MRSREGASARSIRHASGRDSVCQAYEYLGSLLLIVGSLGGRRVTRAAVGAGERPEK